MLARPAPLARLALCLLCLVACDTPAPATDAGPYDGGAPDASPADAGPTVDPAVAAICASMPGYEQACEVDREHVVITADARPAYESLFPGVDAFNMNGWEWWQKWPGGHAPTYEYDEASDAGVTCSVASALRFAAIMHTPPAELDSILAETTWEGRFFNWNDDYSETDSQGDADGAELWAWQDHLIKWISQTARDGSCYLPTRAMLESAAVNCLETGRSSGGHIEGCVN